MSHQTFLQIPFGPRLEDKTGIKIWCGQVMLVLILWKRVGVFLGWFWERETEKTSELPSIAQRVNNSSVYKAKVFHWHFGERERIKAGFITKAAVRNDFGTTLQLDQYLIIATTLKRLDNASDEICLVYFNTKLSWPEASRHIQRLPLSI